MAGNLTFQNLIDSFWAGVLDESNRAVPPLPDPSQATIDHLTTFLRGIYEPRFNRRIIDPKLPPLMPIKTNQCAEDLGRIAVVMFRAQAHQEIGDRPVDIPLAVPNELNEEHITLAREMYGHYTNSSKQKPINAVRGPLLDEIELALQREIDEPCPLCP
jgi:hypothetical protein